MINLDSLYVSSMHSVVVIRNIMKNTKRLHRILSLLLMTAFVAALLPVSTQAAPAPANASAGGPNSPDAPTVQISHPAGSTLIGEGGDYAGETWSDPWDMTSTNDLFLLGGICGSAHPFSAPTIANGV